jgi:hypothetical protein
VNPAHQPSTNSQRSDGAPSEADIFTRADLDPSFWQALVLSPWADSDDEAYLPGSDLEHYIHGLGKFE